ncbi:50S ribosomal protein L18 [candidate division WOR-1 bacterium RIFOXYA12_FULL_43_27]|uniref:Large ribosomal subunit protein uL18 n=1 Tax=candidate division WOR-1 bacterium RIFOXYC2_FULL_46_14 TaxID=1802587 RepID=A0A1F4U5Q9_UNCSA|nr:MAG: 50S ribosomal protein L18 [candidate division WOR-1 bacterium RIFOXYA12_FULL_43_27]OGC20431.1 MAG: 50S ribosomal protein L18 [candidate division WOR-1 bacterium RIFOXYB2_FULL_46_45]OGC31832.1 MAG: 50S ribosomal protein L18 [candidate division WOR-1 bacterium RIFOXYA2_FULL_46_56]OGC40276.1 MAG: 50S ribosomal protein L18 [candidate division WOR-1 bacterium RIFOXYC2_FULL_46_14]
MKRRIIKKKRKIIGTTERPRLSVYRSNNNIFAQVVEDFSGKTLASASSLKLEKGSNIAAAQKVGEALAQAAIKAGVKKVVFDKGEFLYHGRLKALADAARKGGLDF